MSEAPFSLAPNTRFRFESASHAAALEQVRYALARREPVVVLTGEIGTGKTLLCRTVLERLERRTFLSVIHDPLLERDELLKQMLQDFGVISKDRTRLTPTSRHELMHALQEFLASLAPLQAHAVLVIDEAQHVQPDVMEQIRLLSNIHDEGGNTMLQIVLVGQMDLATKLSRPELGQLKQRVTRRLRLESLTAAEVSQYIEHRLTIARQAPTRMQTPGAVELERAIAEWEGPRVVFTAEAIGTVSRRSRGIPRLVNLLCDRAMEAAYERQVRTVDMFLVDGAARALDLPDGAEQGSPAEDLEPAGWSEPGDSSEPPAIPFMRPGGSPPVEWTEQDEETALELGTPGEAAAIEPTEPDEATAIEPPESGDPASIELTRPGEPTAIEWTKPIWPTSSELMERSGQSATESSEPTGEAVSGGYGGFFATPIGSGSSRTLVLAASVALGIAAVVLGGQLVSRLRNAEPQAQAETPPPAAPTRQAGPSEPVPAPEIAPAAGPGAAPVEPPPAPAVPPDTAAAASATSPVDATGEAFEIVVASFRTASRAAALATELEALGQPVRQRVAAGWQQVLAGPYGSRAQADEAQQRLDRAGYAGTQIVPAPR